MPFTAPAEVVVILSGGPAARLPQAQRLHRVDVDETVVKVAQGRHYDHYHAVSESVEVDGLRVPVFRWLYRTYVAE
jgi:hypothetical protein